MAAKAKPYEQFGPFLLFKKLEADSLGELWRAARIDGSSLGEFVALRRFSGGHRTAMMQAAAEASAVVPQLHGTSFVKHQVIDVIDTVPFIAHEYVGGRSLRYIVDRARGGTGAHPNPIPIDQAVLVADRIALSLATTAELRQGDKRLTHGGLIPQLVWITDDGEVRVAGQHLGKGLVASLGDARVNAEIGRYFSPEYHASREATKSSEIYSMGAILFLLVTGHEPPDPLSVTAFTQTIRAAKTMAGQPIPLELRTILDKSLILDPASRYPSMNDMKHALSSVAAKYSSTTFNLAFYLSTLLKKELEAEPADRERESKVNVAAYLAAEPPAAHVAAAAPVAHEEEKKSRMPLFAAVAAIALLAIAGAAFMMLRKPEPPAAAAPVVVHTAAAKPAPAFEPIVASTAPPATTAQTATVDPNASKKAFEDAVNRQMQEEMLKLQSNFTRQLQQKKSPAAPVVSEPEPQRAQSQPQPQPQAAATEPSAAALDERRRAEQTPAPQPVVPAPQPAAQPAAVEEAPARVIQDGDVVEMSDLDTVPRLLRAPIVTYPPMAVKQRIQTSVIVTALVSENGDVIDVRVLRGDPRFGFNEAAIRALKNVKFTPAVKSGKRVKTWWPQTVNFKL
jgi:TonB family protein